MDILLFGDMVSRMGDTLENPFLGREESRNVAGAVRRGYLHYKQKEL